MNVSAAEVRLVGRDSCSSSGCHGGAGARQNQALIWSRQDPHARAAATLTSARSRRIAQVLKIADPTRDRSCTSCHSPWQGVTAELLPRTGKEFNVHNESVSCETCHGAAVNWIRSHTRPDLTRDDKALDGLRNLTIFYNRANACVACHQVLDSKMYAAGHPELLFELDGQTSAMPRHWVESDGQFRTKAWVTGQAVALRELTAQLVEQEKTGKILSQASNQWDSVLWVVTRALPEHKIAKANADTNGSSANTHGESLRALHLLADSLAMEASVQVRDEPITLVRRLSGTAGDFANRGGEKLIQAMRAERLVLALDRLSHALPADLRKALDEQLGAMFALVESRPDFDAPKFARLVEGLQMTLETRQLSKTKE